MIAYVDRDRCTGCGACVKACPAQAVRLVDGKAQIDATLCRGCEVCVDVCPERAIVSVSAPVAAESRVVPAARPPREAVPAAPIVRLARRTGPWLGAALAFAAREIVPRLTMSLLDAWDRRRASTPLVDRRPRGQTLTPGALDRHAHQHRWRHGR